MNFNDILFNLPEVKGPIEKKISFNVKLKWTLIILVAFFVLANIPLYGLTANSLERFEYLAIILGTEFGSIISLGIGPIVMASIILQLLVGAKLINIDMTSHEGKKYFQGLQKILSVFFCLFEATIYVVMRGLEAAPGMQGLLIFQLFLGGIIIILMDEVVSKWGFGSGVSLFIAAGVGWHLFTAAFGFIGPQNTITAIGKVWVFFSSIAAADTINATAAASAIIATIIIFLIVVYAQSIKVEIPLSFDRLRGFAMKWPLSFFYTSNIPVILTAALLANIQLAARLIESAVGHPTFLGGFTHGVPTSGIAAFLSSPAILENIIRGSFTGIMILQSFVYLLFMILGSIMFAVFWVKTSGMDASNVANQIIASGLQIPGFRKDPRVLESILSRYIMPLTVMGAATVGLLAATADLLGALVRGTGLLLAVMIVYKLYEEIAQQHAYDMHPMLKKVIAE
ncbi:MAG: preprotein translocase subunit SecY [Candidatus Pacearchaeota archaeon]